MTPLHSQVHFQPHPQQSGWTSHFGLPYKLPDSNYGTQLQFNLLSPQKASNLETNFHKPRPIVIEKLAPAISAFAPFTRARGGLQGAPNSLPLTSLSSERLAFAVQLAKQDVKKLKRMLSGSNEKVTELLNGHSHPGNEQKEHVEYPYKEKLKNDVREVRQPKKSVHRQVKDTLNKQNNQTPGKVLLLKGNQEDAQTEDKIHRMKFYDTEEVQAAIKNVKEEQQSKEASEIRRLRKELHQYMKKLDDVVSQKAAASQSKGGKTKGKKEFMFEEPQETERKALRAEEQSSRSARMLYMLQRKVQEIQDELDHKEKNVKHTKKSHSMNRLAAAHRSAVRALQMFVNHAPLYFDMNHGLPPMYQELALLIRQLSLLSSNFELGKDMTEFDIDLLPRTKKLISAWGKNQNKKTGRTKPKVPLPQNRIPSVKIQEVKRPIQEQRSNFLDKHSDWRKDKAEQMAISTNGHQMDDQPTPERKAVLEAGMDAIKRVEESSSFVDQNVESMRTKHHTKAVPTKKPKPRSLLLPSHILKQRQKFDSQRQQPVPVPLAPQTMHFADPTVSSLLKKEEKKDVKAPRTPPKEIFTNAKVSKSPGTLRHKDKELLKEIHIADNRVSPRVTGQSPKQIKRSLHYDNEMVDREIARQAWLDRERERELERLENLRRKEEDHLQQLRHEYAESQRLIEKAEEKIRDKVQPLIQKAEFVAEKEKLREEDFKKSIKSRLAELASETAMSKGEVLADLLLDDIITETVHELQRIENEEEVKADAVFLQKQPDLETVLQRIENFEKEEEEIRRHWKQLQYSEVDIQEQAGGETIHMERIIDPRPILFTAAGNEYPSPLKSEKGIVEESTATKDNFARPPDRKMRKPDLSLVRPSIPLFVPLEMCRSVMANKSRYDKYLQNTSTERHGTFDPWSFVERISEGLLEDLIKEVSKEVEEICDNYVEDVYAHEFVKDTG